MPAFDPPGLCLVSEEDPDETGRRLEAMWIETMNTSRPRLAIHCTAVSTSLIHLPIPAGWTSGRYCT